MLPDRSSRNNWLAAGTTDYPEALHEGRHIIFDHVQDLSQFPTIQGSRDRRIIHDLSITMEISIGRAADCLNHPGRLLVSP
jgi:hypothetical protein